MENHEKRIVTSAMTNPAAAVATRVLHLPEALCAQAEHSVAPAFGGLEPLLTFILIEMLRDDSQKLDQADEKLIEARLRDLGYI